MDGKIAWNFTMTSMALSSSHYCSFSGNSIALPIRGTPGTGSKSSMPRSTSRHFAPQIEQ